MIHHVVVAPVALKTQGGNRQPARQRVDQLVVGLHRDEINQRLGLLDPGALKAVHTGHPGTVATMGVVLTRATPATETGAGAITHPDHRLLAQPPARATPV